MYELQLFFSNSTIYLFLDIFLFVDLKTFELSFYKKQSKNLIKLHWLTNFERNVSLPTKKSRKKEAIGR